MRIGISVCLFALSFICISLASCSKRISVTGWAQNDKNIAIVLNKQGQYFLNGVHHWDSQYLDKKVRVTGTLLVVKKDTLHPPGYTQSWDMDMYYILKPKWKLVK